MLEMTGRPPACEGLPLSLRYLRAFYQVCRCGSVSEASKALRRAQSAVTRAISQLESELEAPLFERSVHGMLPTEFGDALLNRVERAFAYMDTAFREITAFTGLGKHAPIYDLHMTERQLNVLVELRSQRHMGTVASVLAISQPAVSLALRNIEQLVGIRLFERTVRGMHPTPAGETLVRHLRLALNEIRIAADELAAIRGVEQGEIRVGALSLGSTDLLPTAVTRLLRKHPGLRVSTTEGPFETLAAALRGGEIDFIIGALRPPKYTEGLSREPLADDEMAIVARSGHPLSLRKRIGFHDLAGAQWVMPHRHTSTRALLESAAAARGAPAPDVALETTDLTIIREVLLESDMITAISPRQLSREISAGMLARLPIALPETLRQIGMLRRENDHPSPGANLLAEEMRAA